MEKEKNEEVPVATKEPRPATAATAQNRTTRLFRCEKDDCCIAFTTKAALEEHQKKHLRIKPFLCEKEGCGRRFVLKQELVRHFRQKHSDAGPPSFICDDCEKSFIEKAILIRHTIAIHQRQKPHRCHVCRKEFALKGTLTKHLMTHAPKTLACPHCSMSFTQIGSLNKHRDHYCTANPARTDEPMPAVVHVCGVCQKKFRFASGLQQHARIHTKERPFACPHCVWAFAEKGSLNRHVRAKHPGVVQQSPAGGKKIDETVYAASKGQSGTGDAAKKMDVDPDVDVGGHRTSNDPIATVSRILPRSPATDAGLKNDDIVIKFGSICAANFSQLSQIAELVQNSIGKRVRVTVLRDGRAVRLVLIPQKWNGHGLLGCDILPNETMPL